MAEGKELQFVPDSTEQKTPEKPRVDFELDPETEAMVMEKICDVNEKGNAISAILGFRIESSLGTLNNILEMGLLGTSGRGRVGKSEWLEAAKNGEAEVWMNVVGAGGDIPRISKAFYMESDATEIGLLLDLKGFKHKVPKTWEKTAGSSGSFRASAGSWIDGTVHEAVELGFDPKGTMEELKSFLIEHRKELKVTDETLKYFGQYYITDPEMGFVASHRVAPRNFKGLIFRPTRGIRRGEQDGYTGKVVKEPDPAIIDKKLQAVVKQMMLTYSKKPKSLIPIYDIDGNLLWPKKMSYSEIKKIIAKKGEEKNDEALASSGI